MIWISMLSVVISSVAFCFSIKVFHSNRDFAEKTIRAEKESIWFRDIVVRPHLEIIDQFYGEAKRLFSETSVLLEGYIANNNIMEVAKTCKRAMVDIKNLLTFFRSDFVSIVDAVQPDCGAELNTALLRFEESIKTYYESVQVSGLKYVHQPFGVIIEKNRMDFIRVLYEYEMKYLTAEL